MISRMVHPRRRGRRVLAVVAGFGLAAALLASAAVALAVWDKGLFELDTSSDPAVCDPVTTPKCGNANVADDAAAGDDWVNVYKSATGLGTAGPDSAFGRAFITDPVSGAENSYYTGGGSKDVNDIPKWQYATTNDVVPDKDDIAHAFAAAYQVPENDPETERDHDTFIYFGMDRYDNNGDAETGFWFFKDKVDLVDGKFTGEHSPGDVLVLANWGGSNPLGELTVYEWVGGKNPLLLVSDTFQADCATAAADANICAVVNRQLVSQPWPFLDKSGSTSIRPLELFEAGINLTKTFGEDRCFASFLVATRSSHSTTAQLKDLALGSFEQCGASITIEASDTNDVNDDHTFTVTVSKSTGGVAQGAEGVFPDVDLTASNGATLDVVEDTCATTGTDSDGQCTVTVNSTTGGLISAHASATVTIGTDSFDVETDGQAPNSGDAYKRYVDATIDITPDATNEVGDPHTFTVTVQKDEGTGNGLVAAAGENPTVTLTDEDGSTVTPTADTCASPGTDAAGQCTVTVNSSVGTTITAHAEVDIDFGATTLTPAISDVHRETGSESNPDAVKVYVDASIEIEQTATNEVGQPHTFTVTVKQDTGDGSGLVNAPDGTMPTVTLTDANGATITDVTDNCDLTGTVAGECTIDFNSTTTGTVTGSATVTLTLGGIDVTRSTDGTGNNSGVAVKTYVDARIAIEETATNEVNDDHVFTVTVEQDNGDGNGFGSPADGTLVSVTLTDQGGNAVTPVEDLCGTTGLAAGECTVTVNSTVGITITASASATLDLGPAGQTIQVTRSTDGTGDNSGPAAKTYVDAYITIGDDGVNTVGDPHEFTVTVMVDNGDGLGFVAAPDGTTPTVTWDSEDFADLYVEDACAATGTTGGTCAYTVNSAVPGTLTVHAAVTVDLGPAGATISVTRETDGTGYNSGDAQKIYVAGSLSWHKVDDAGQPLAGATFTVCQTQAWDFELGSAVDIDEADQVCFDVSDNEDPDGSLSDGEFFIGGLELGTYSVVEKTAPAGYTKDPSTKYAYLTDEIRTADIEVAFVDSREILKITGFGYTNELVVEDDGLPTHGVTHGLTVFTGSLRNYGVADALLTNSSLTVTTTSSDPGTVLCSGPGVTGDQANGWVLDLSGTTILGGGTSDPFEISCEYDGVADGTELVADLVVKSTTNGTEREASGSPASIRFTVQAD